MRPILGLKHSNKATSHLWMFQGTESEARRACGGRKLTRWEGLCGHRAIAGPWPIEPLADRRGDVVTSKGLKGNIKCHRRISRLGCRYYTKACVRTGAAMLWLMIIRIQNKTVKCYIWQLQIAFFCVILVTGGVTLALHQLVPSLLDVGKL